jgi:hypothetical protein
MYNIFLFILVGTVFLLQLTDAQLSGVESSAKLPTPRTLTSAVYDGEDSIYIVGGSEDEFHTFDFLKYSISNDTLEFTKTSQSLSYGRVAMDFNTKEIYYIGGFLDFLINYDVLKFNPDNSSWTVHTTLPLEQASYAFSLVQPSPDTALLFGGSLYQSIVEVNLTSKNARQLLNNIPELAQNDGCTATLINEEGDVIIFAYPTLNTDSSSVVKYSVASGNYSLAAGPPVSNYLYSSSIWDEKNVYMIAGASIGQFNPVTNEWKGFLAVNFPPNWSHVIGTSSVYVPKLNRVYIFGGGSLSDFKIFDGIWWIDLDMIK